jgi:hypothetical protein
MNAHIHHHFNQIKSEKCKSFSQLFLQSFPQKKDEVAHISPWDNLIKLFTQLEKFTRVSFKAQRDAALLSINLITVS